MRLKLLKKKNNTALNSARLEEMDNNNKKYINYTVRTTNKEND